MSSRSERSSKRPGDSHDLLGALTLSEYHLRHPIAESAVVVDQREADIFVRQVPKLAYGRVDVRSAIGDGGEQFTESVFFDGVTPARIRIFHDSTGGHRHPA